MLPTVEIGLLVFLAFYVPAILVLYGRQGRWSGALGWSLLVGGVTSLGVGASRSFAWGGLVCFAVSALGLIFILMDVVARPKRR